VRSATGAALVEGGKSNSGAGKLSWRRSAGRTKVQL